jgi:hypothetical protein
MQFEIQCYFSYKRGLTKYFPETQFDRRSICDGLNFDLERRFNQFLDRGSESLCGFLARFVRNEATRKPER